MNSAAPQYSSTAEGISVDGDGVIIDPDYDLAKIYFDLLDPDSGKNKFEEVSDAVLEEVEQGNCPYGYTLAVLEDFLDGVPAQNLEKLGKKAKLFPGAKEAVNSLEEEYKGDIVLATTAYEPAASMIAERVGIPYLATEIEISDGVMKGNVTVFNGGEEKKNRVGSYFEERGKEKVLHVGDGWSDVDSMKESPSIALNPKYPEVITAADLALFTVDLRGLSSFILDGELYKNEDEVVKVSDINSEDEIKRYCGLGREIRQQISDSEVEFDLELEDGRSLEGLDVERLIKKKLGG